MVRPYWLVLRAQRNGHNADAPPRIAAAERVATSTHAADTTADDGDAELVEVLRRQRYLDEKMRTL